MKPVNTITFEFEISRVNFKF